MIEPTRHTFTDPISRSTVVLLVEPTKPLWDGGLAVEHPDCPDFADVAVDLDSFYCRACSWAGRISGAWAFDLWAGETK